jgi:nickel/cobalt exporter
VAFGILRFIVSQTPLMTARGSPFFAVTGYGLILIAGALMIFQSLRPAAMHAGPHVLTTGIGLLPCPLTITVLGFAWAQGAGPMVAVVLIALAMGIAFTIGIVALLAILGRRLVGQALVERMPAFERGARIFQGVAGAAIVALSIYAIVTSLPVGRYSVTYRAVSECPCRLAENATRAFEPSGACNLPIIMFG